MVVFELEQVAESEGLEVLFNVLYVVANPREATCIVSGLDGRRAAIDGVDVILRPQIEPRQAVGRFLLTKNIQLILQFPNLALLIFYGLAQFLDEFLLVLKLRVFALQLLVQLGELAPLRLLLDRQFVYNLLQVVYFLLFLLLSDGGIRV